MSFFFANLVFSPRHPGVSRGLFDFLPELYAQSSSTSALTCATQATALAAFGNIAGPDHKDQLSPLAWRTYGNALRELNSALTDPFLARRNETLMTVLLFCMAESLLIPHSTTPSQASASTSHIDGAVSLLKLRGPCLLESEMSARLFLAVRTHMMISRMQEGKPLDNYFYSQTTGWQHDVAPSIQNPANRLSQYTLLVPALRSRATSLLQMSMTQWNIYAVTMLLHDVRSVDQMLATWPASIPDSWHYTAISQARWTSTTPLPADYTYQVYPGDIDSYYDIWIGSVWNAYRVSRLFLNAIILRCASWLATLPNKSADENAECAIARTRIQELVDQICASAPFFLGYDKRTLPAALSLKSLVSSPEYTFSALRPTQPSTICGYFVLWPIFVARSALTVGHSQRSFLRSRMLEISERFGIKQAGMLVEVGDQDSNRPLFSQKWDAGVYERMWEHANLYASSGI